jgi:hypothetical protein
MTTTAARAAILALLAATSLPATSALAQVSIQAVTRSVTLRNFVYAPPENPTLGDQYSNTDTFFGSWSDSKHFDFAAGQGGDDGLGTSIGTVFHSSSILETGFTGQGSAEIALSSSGVCSSDAFAETVLEVRFSLDASSTVHLRGTLTPAMGGGNGGAFAMSVMEFSSESGEQLAASAMSHDETLVLPPGAYVYSILARTSESACNSTCASDAATNFRFAVDFAPAPCRADFNGDAQADFFDYLDFAIAFDAEDPSADFDGNNQVDFFDYLDFAEAFAAGC